MPTFYDKADIGGVKITVIPNNVLFRRILKKFSRPLVVGDTVDITLKLEKLNNFDAHFWEKRKVISKLPERKEDYVAEINWGNKMVVEKRIQSIRIDCEGDIYYRMPKVVMSIYDFGSKDTISIYSASVENSDWKRNSLIAAIVGGIIVGIIILCLQYFTGVY